MNEAYVIRTIQDYADEYLGDLGPRCSKADLRELSYSRWAVDEIINRIVEEASKLPAHITGIELVPHTEILRDFIYEMDYYLSTSETKEAKLIFLTAKRIGVEVLELFL